MAMEVAIRGKRIWAMNWRAAASHPAARLVRMPDGGEESE
jgi:hypothetical protein